MSCNQNADLDSVRFGCIRQINVIDGKQTVLHAQATFVIGGPTFNDVFNINSLGLAEIMNKLSNEGGSSSHPTLCLFLLEYRVPTHSHPMYGKQK